MSDVVSLNPPGAEAPAAAGQAVEPAGPPRMGTGVTIAKNSLWLMVDSIVSMAASFYASIFVARRMGPDFMGRYNYILYFAMVLRMVTEVAIPATVRKFAAEYSGRGDYTLVKTLIDRALRLQVKVLVLGVTVGLVIVQTTFSADLRMVATVVVFSVIPSLLISIPTGALWATENLRHNVVSSLCGTILNVIGVTLSVLLGWGLLGLTASLLVSRSVDCVIRFAIFRQQYAKLPGEAQPALEPEIRTRMIRFASQQLVLALLYSLLFDRTEVFFLHRLAPSQEIAFFSISFTLVQYLLLLPQNLANSASVSMWVQQGRSPKDAARTAATSTWFILIFAAPELFGVAAVSDPLLRLIYGAKYLPAIPVLASLALFGLALTVSQPAQYMLVGAERQRFYIFWLCLAGAIDVAGNFLLIPRYGALGATYAKGASEIFGAAGFLAYLLVVFKAKLPIARMLRLLAACVAMFVVVRLVGHRLPPLLTLLVGIPLGAGVFLVLVRLLRCIDGEDADRLRQMKRLVPAAVRGPYVRVVAFLDPASA
jgi:O-antigen/teichoic acid export membrane protein